MFENYDGMSVIPEPKYKAIDNITNIDSPINCERPSIVFNPKWFQYLFTCADICLGGEVFSTFQFRTLTQSQMQTYIRNNFYVDINNYTSFCFPTAKRLIPIYMLVPCGHCHCCKTNKSNEYAFRSTCETAVSDEIPLFLTITYRDPYCPKDGVNVDDLQRFFKKLRWHLEEKTGEPSNLRYLATSEYGTKKGRPHYHVILWNYPYEHPCFKGNYKLADRVIYKSWKTYMKFNGKRKYHKNRKPAMISLGQIKILQVKEGCTSYITKYFGKDDHNKLGYPNKTFLLSSRRNGGIGAAYLRTKFDEVYKNRYNPKYTLKVFNKELQKEEDRRVGGYIKNLLFPSKSNILPKKIYETIRDIELHYHTVMAYFVSLSMPQDEMLPFMRSIIKKLSHWIFSYPPVYYTVQYRWLFNLGRKTRIKEMMSRYRDMLNLFFNLPLDLIKKASERLDLRDEFLYARSTIEYDLHVNMITQFDKYHRNYVAYKNKCTF